ncbi:MAG: pentapeptide repeat-containing protein [Kofleriaceae bacterium]
MPPTPSNLPPSPARDLQEFKRELASGRRRWPSLVLPWDAELGGLALSGCELPGASLRGAILDGAQLDGCKLTEADLRRASLRGAILVRADLRGADLRGADLRGADLTKADLCEAELVGADLRGAILDGAAISFGCGGFAGVRVSGLMLRQLYGLMLMTRPDDPEVLRALETLRDTLALSEEEARPQLELLDLPAERAAGGA